MLKNGISLYISIVSWALVVVMMVVIFSFSAQDASASSNISGELSETVIIIVEETFPNADVQEESFEITLRNVAHFTLYFTLGFLVFNAIFLYNISNVKVVLLSFLFSFVYALTDEWHQYYVPGRAFELSDLLIDSLGAISGILLILLLKSWKLGKTSEESVN